MVYKCFIKKRFGKHPKRCDRCGKPFNIGDVYYSRYHKMNVREHICPDCYEKIFVDSEVHKS